MAFNLQIGEIHFVVSIPSLLKSGYFKALLKDPSTALKTGGDSIFVDQDGDVFRHVLSFLRGGDFPILFSPETGHDHHMYTRILQQAKFFQVDELVDWLTAKRYERAVRVIYYPKIFEDKELDALAAMKTGNSRITFQAFTHEREVYICPRGIAVHYDKPGACGAACREAAAKDNVSTVEKVLDKYLFMGIKHIEFNARYCSAATLPGVDDVDPLEDGDGDEDGDEDGDGGA